MALTISRIGHRRGQPVFAGGGNKRHNDRLFRVSPGRFRSEGQQAMLLAGRCPHDASPHRLRHPLESRLAPAIHSRIPVSRRPLTKRVCQDFSALTPRFGRWLLWYVRFVKGFSFLSNNPQSISLNNLIVRFQRRLREFN